MGSCSGSPGSLNPNNVLKEPNSSGYFLQEAEHYGGTVKKNMQNP